MEHLVTENMAPPASFLIPFEHWLREFLGHIKFQQLSVYASSTIYVIKVKKCINGGI